MITGILGIAAGVWAVVEFTNKFWEVKKVSEVKRFEWLQVTLTPAVWHYTDGDAVKAQVSQCGKHWRWETCNDGKEGSSVTYGVLDDLKEAQGEVIKWVK